MMNEKHEQMRDPDLFYCFVNINGGREGMSEEPDIFQARLWAWPTAACAPHTVCVTGSLGDADTERCRRLAHAWRRMRTGLKK